MFLPPKYACVPNLYQPIPTVTMRKGNTNAEEFLCDTEGEEGDVTKATVFFNTLGISVRRSLPRMADF